METVASHYNRICLLYGKMEGALPSHIRQHENMVAAIRRRDAEALRQAVKEHSGSLLEQVNSMAKQYPQFF
ncbi:FCD domain-containing protein [Paenibacillus macerans]|uniref:FCD domain-containing protein n=1 Tax=Paenibacillus macerans TaxID=44252 RepID=UPI003D29CCDB